MKTNIFIIPLLLFVQLFCINKNYGQAPNLGITYNFAVFTAVGAFENNGETQIIGDIGTNIGSFTGFSIGTVEGDIHVTDSISAIAATDVNIAYNYLLDVACDSILDPIIGNNQILTPYAYCISAATALQGDLILDGQGNSNAIFIIKIDGAFSSSKFSNVILTNSASTNNVYWQINGAVELGDSSIFRGTIIANGAISILESTLLYGRGLSRAGAISLHKNTIIKPTPPVLLPIELQDFTANFTNNKVEIAWCTSSETNNTHFTIRRSNDGIYFESIDVIVGAGTSNLNQYYNTSDNYPFNGISYYQLVQTDFNSNKTYSNIISISIEKAFNVTIYPNPFNSKLTIIMHNTMQNENNEFTIFNSLGEIILQSMLYKQISVFDTSNFLSDIYVYQITQNKYLIQSGTLISKK